MIIIAIMVITRIIIVGIRALAILILHISLHCQALVFIVGTHADVISDRREEVEADDGVFLFNLGLRVQGLGFIAPFQ